MFYYIIQYTSTHWCNLYSSGRKRNIGTIWCKSVTNNTSSECVQY